MFYQSKLDRAIPILFPAKLDLAMNLGFNFPVKVQEEQIFLYQCLHLFPPSLSNQQAELPKWYLKYPKSKRVRTCKMFLARYPIRTNCNRFRSTYYTTKASEQNAGLVGEEEEEEDVHEDSRKLPQLKAQLFQQVNGINRGILGVPSSKKSDIEILVKLLESQNPTPDPTLNLDKVGGFWKLVYSTITILGSKRTKLGLRDFITLGDFLQTIDVDKSKAINVIKFNARGLSLLNGKLTIEASFKIASNSRVDIKYDKSTITPDQLMNVFRKNYDLLLAIFNPEGWLDITYVDDTMRIGRDGEGNIFILERSEEHSD